MCFAIPWPCSCYKPVSTEPSSLFGWGMSRSRRLKFDANLTLKEEILAKTISPGGKLVRFMPDDELMTFLNHL
jgi:hypothetical protein